MTAVIAGFGSRALAELCRRFSLLDNFKDPSAQFGGFLLRARD